MDAASSREREKWTSASDRSPIQQISSPDAVGVERTLLTMKSAIWRPKALGFEGTAIPTMHVKWAHFLENQSKKRQSISNKFTDRKHRKQRRRYGQK
ncbi:hypothetical protein E6O75_ATG11158 [Venturia nashicola]|uniref:Uncharacterized protein n=1 Tax=Venturia nashicola TaxID=86259 RepID=A0A4Z1PKH3_9PEZI|nr:hypothetical protein E6O75_ATG11158 [Venturia nashicola]